MNLLNHPAFQSLVLPLLLCIAGVAALLRAAGPNRAALGAALGLLVAFAVFPGFDWPAAARAQKLPWIALAGTAIAALLLWRATRGLPTARPWWRGIAFAAVLTLACLGLAAAAGLGGSLLLAQLALMVAVATAVPGLWSWWRPSSGLWMAPAALLPQLLAALWIAAALPMAPWNAGAAGSATDDLYYTPQWK
ncbi:MAG: hypothetical protein KIT86_02005 [Hydrogenophaga sp.]|uniref:hypothetical protein n=1 Tax=Hydrogenophaga sp. TaxID=1904254 RepID=UPI002628D1EA|nr:hypothetical protein [Hydrogenophaga sp.]MCW5668403.1 hypothetical protein [Hydrogenophaga sp.]